MLKNFVTFHMIFKKLLKSFSLSIINAHLLLIDHFQKDCGVGSEG